MESGRGSGGGLRSGSGGKKMRKRKELDALVGGVSAGKRGGSGSKRAGSGGISPQDQLLSESTGEEEYWSSKGGKGRRRYVGGGGSRPGKPCQALLRACSVLLIMACLVATLTVMWLFIDIREQTAYLHSQLDQVAAGSQGVPDALQKCHSLSKELQNNQTNLFSQLAALSLQLSNFTTQISVVQGGLSSVEEKLKASPELVNVPHDLQALSGSVASFGSQIQDLQSTSEHLKDEHTTVLETMKTLQMNISNLNKSITEFLKTPVSMNDSNAINALEEEKKLEILVSALKSNVSLINDTLSKKFLWVQDDQRKDYRKIEDLRELGANASSQITTIHNAMSGQEKNFKEMEERFSNFTLEVGLFKTQANKQFTSFNERIKKLENSTTHVYDEVSYIKTPSHDFGEQNLTSVSTHRDMSNPSSNDHHITPGGNTTTN